MFFKPAPLALIAYLAVVVMAQDDDVNFACITSQRLMCCNETTELCQLQVPDANWFVRLDLCSVNLAA